MPHSVDILLIAQMTMMSIENKNLEAHHFLELLPLWTVLVPNNLG